jgi:hypothetical protein
MEMKNTFKVMFSALVLLSSSQLVMAESFAEAESRIDSSLVGKSISGGSLDSRSPISTVTGGAEGDTGTDFVTTKYVARDTNYYCSPIRDYCYQPPTIVNMGKHDFCTLSSKTRKLVKKWPFHNYWPSEFNSSSACYFRVVGSNRYLYALASSHYFAVICRATCWDQN